MSCLSSWADHMLRMIIREFGAYCVVPLSVLIIGVLGVALPCGTLIIATTPTILIVIPRYHAHRSPGSYAWLRSNPNPK